jgi:hypothetical protein
MSIFSKLRDMWYRERTKALIRSVESRTQPLLDLSNAVLKGAIECAFALKTEINPEEHPDAWVKVCFEFVFFFAHLVNRAAFSILGNERRTILQDKVRPVLAQGVLAALFDHWPEERKVGIEHEFLENLNTSELGYAKCEGLFSKEEPVTGNSLVSTLARNVAELLEKPLDPMIILGTVQAATTQIQGLNLDALVKAAGEQIN